MRKLALITASLALFVSACSDAGNNEPVSLVDELSEVNKMYFTQRPEQATMLGVFDDKAGEGVMASLTNYSPHAEMERRKTIRDMIDELRGIDKDRLSPRDKINLDNIATSMYGAYLPSATVSYGSVVAGFGTWFLPYSVNHMSGPQYEVQTMLEDKHPLQNIAQAEAFIARLAAYPRVIDGLIAKVKHDEELGVIPPDFVIENVIASLKKLLSDNASESTLVKAFVKKLTENNVEGIDQLTERVVGLIEEAFYPATQKLIDVMEEQLPKAVHTAGIHRLPRGEELYQALITHMTDTTLEAEEIHNLGLSEVDRIHAEMDVLLKQIGLNEGTVGERMQSMLNDPKYSYPNTDEGKTQLIADMRSDLDMLNERLPQWFGLLPDQDVAIKRVPPHREGSGPTAFYIAPSLDGSSLGTYWIDLRDTAAYPSYSLQSLTYHETNPGHHLQTVIGMSDTNPILGSVFYSNAAGEGWGLYSERLASEMGLYEGDPEDDLGRLQWELHRAVRLVVDTGMHVKGWSREQAIKYSIDIEGIHIDDATAEIERYAVWPGQALGYKLGELKIVELRERARETLGEKFDIRTFHDAILENGTLPLNLMEQKIDEWILNSNK